MMGGCGLAYEYTLSKVSSDLLGNSARQWALIIGVMMFFMGIGSDCQKKISDQKIFDRFIAFEIILGVLGGFGPICMLWSYGAFSSHFILVQYFFISAVGFLIGLEIPLLMRINEAYSKELKDNVGTILKMDYIGALAGALSWVFILTKFFSIVETAFVLGLINVTTGILALFFFKDKMKRFRWLAGFSYCSILILFVGFILAKPWSSYAEQHLYLDQVIFSKTTEFQHIVLTKSSAGDFSCFINGHLQFNSEDEHIYHENLVHPAMTIALRKRKVLVLGGGDGLAAREILKYPEVEEIVLVDIDPVVTDLASTHPLFTELNDNSLKHAKVNIINNHNLESIGEEDLYVRNRRAKHKHSESKVASIRIVNIDAAKFVEEIPGRFDVIIIDFPDPNALELAKLYSTEFYQNVKKRLAADGVLVQQSTSPIHSKEAFLCIGRTMKGAGLAVVPYHDNVPSFGEWGWWIGGIKGIHSEFEIRNRLLSIPILTKSTRYLTLDLLKGALEFGKGQLTTKETEVTTLTSSKVYEYYRLGWARGN